MELPGGWGRPARQRDGGCYGQKTRKLKFPQMRKGVGGVLKSQTKGKENIRQSRGAHQTDVVTGERKDARLKGGSLPPN